MSWPLKEDMFVNSYFNACKGEFILGEVKRGWEEGRKSNNTIFLVRTEALQKCQLLLLLSRSIMDLKNYFIHSLATSKDSCGLGWTCCKDGWEFKFGVGCISDKDILAYKLRIQGEKIVKHHSCLWSQIDGIKTLPSILESDWSKKSSRA